MFVDCDGKGFWDAKKSQAHIESRTLDLPRCVVVKVRQYFLLSLTPFKCLKKIRDFYYYISICSAVIAIHATAAWWETWTAHKRNDVKIPTISYPSRPCCKQIRARTALLHNGSKQSNSSFPALVKVCGEMIHVFFSNCIWWRRPSSTRMVASVTLSFSDTIASLPSRHSTRERVWQGRSTLI